MPGAEGNSRGVFEQSASMKRIVPALQYAHLAVEHDKKGAALAAITNYKLAVSHLFIKNV